jgi:probable phosphoglycerate mutase
MEKHIYFVRHGESDTNHDGILRGPLTNLTDLGRQQAEEVAKRVERLGVTALIASTYPRAIQTADAIERRLGLPMETSDLFVEIRGSSARLNLHHTDPIVARIYTEIDEGYETPGHRHSDEENFDDIKARALAALRALESHPAERICVVTHGHFLRALFGAMWAGEALTGTEFRRNMKKLLTDNTGITYATHGKSPLSGQENSWTLISWNDSAHLG